MLRNAEVKEVLNSIGSRCPSDGRRLGASAAMPASVFVSLNHLTSSSWLCHSGYLRDSRKSARARKTGNILQGKKEACKKYFIYEMSSKGWWRGGVFVVAHGRLCVSLRTLKVQHQLERPWVYCCRAEVNRVYGLKADTESNALLLQLGQSMFSFSR